MLIENLKAEADEAVRIVRKFARLYEQATEAAARLQNERDAAREDAAEARGDMTNAQQLKERNDAEAKRAKAVARLVINAEAFMMTWENEDGDAAMSRAADALFLALEDVRNSGQTMRVGR